MVTRKVPRGRRPKDPEQAKTTHLSTRFRPDLKARLEEAAQAIGRSLSEEIEKRLSASFEEENLFGGAVTSWVLKVIANASKEIDQRTHRRWYEDAYTFDEWKRFIIGWLDMLKPEGEATLPNQGGLLAVPDPTPPSEIALRNAVGQMVLIMAALKANIDVPASSAEVAKRLGKRMRFSEQERKEMDLMRQLLANGAVTIGEHK